jgi:hypothetical protein
MAISDHTIGKERKPRIHLTNAMTMERRGRGGRRSRERRQRGSLGGNGIQSRGHENSMRSNGARLRRKVVD